MDTQQCQNHGPVRLLVPLLEFNLTEVFGPMWLARVRGVEFDIAVDVSIRKLFANLGG